MNEANNSRLTITFFVGLNEKEEPVYQTKNFQNVKPDAESQKMYSTAEALISLQSLQAEKIERFNTYQLIEM